MDMHVARSTTAAPATQGKQLVKAVVTDRLHNGVIGFSFECDFLSVPLYDSQFGHAKLSLISVNKNAADRAAGINAIEIIVDLIKAQCVGDQRIDRDLAVHIQVNDLGHVGVASGAAERGAFSYATNDQLERTDADFLASFSHADDIARAPAAMTSFKCGAHDIHNAGTIERDDIEHR